MLTTFAKIAVGGHPDPQMATKEQFLQEKVVSQWILEPMHAGEHKPVAFER